MPRTIEGHYDARGLKVGIVVSRFNSFISERLLEGALDALLRHGAAEQDIQVYRVPGAFELPAAVKRLAEQGAFDAVLCLGCLIRGGTPHFDLIAAEVFKGMAAIAMEHQLPVGMGVITADTLEQAIERGGSKMGNKGFEAAQAALEMAHLYKAMETRKA
ncbi:MAG: 6,7-dimethyl-8-ribityllumazine synthase [Deltaproteobacteria bacterium]|nr:6,7-dimethyl-8-ribityllumazine synthase [Deltaproteobacteria bacterium]